MEKGKVEGFNEALNCLKNIFDLFILYCSFKIYFSNTTLGICIDLKENLTVSKSLFFPLSPVKIIPNYILFFSSQTLATFDHVIWIGVLQPFSLTFLSFISLRTKFSCHFSLPLKIDEPFTLD